MITKKPISVAGIIGPQATMTAPTVPTAPLPSKLETAIRQGDENAAKCETEFARNWWTVIKGALLTMQRERDEAIETADACRENLQAGDLVTANKLLRMMANELVPLRENFAASERTCAELRADNERMGAETLECAQIIGAAMCELAGIPDEGLHIGHLPDMCRDYVDGSQAADWQLEAACEHWKRRAEAAERTVDGCMREARMQKPESAASMIARLAADFAVPVAARDHFPHQLD